MLKVGKGDAAHERMPMQPSPRSSLESPEAKLLLELLMGLLADPPRFDAGGEAAQRRAWR